jgi:hypothetical protein
MDDPKYTISFGGEGDAWKVIFLPKGYGPDADQRVAWSRPERDDDPEEGYPDDVVAMRNELNKRLRLARGFDVFHAAKEVIA